jgi:tRNA (guanine-N7-)-methyltransferase
MTHAQRRAFAEWWERFGIEAGHIPLEPESVFGRRAPLVLEVGFGDGESLAALAMAHPELDYLGIEVHRPGVGHLLLRAAALGLTNVRVMCADAVEVLEQQLPDQCLDRVQIFFPDPWPKTRHHKRRLIQPPFVALLARKLKPAGQLHVATDCEQYARAILDLLDQTPEWVNRAADKGFVPHPAQRPPTKFELRGRRLGHAVWDLLFVKMEGA